MLLGNVIGIATSTNTTMKYYEEKKYVGFSLLLFSQKKGLVKKLKNKRNHTNFLNKSLTNKTITSQKVGWVILDSDVIR